MAATERTLNLKKKLLSDGVQILIASYYLVKIKLITLFIQLIYISSPLAYGLFDM
jgi:hypothetical protein